MPRLDINPSLIGYLGNNGLSQFGIAAMRYADDSVANDRVKAKIKLEEDAQKSMNEFKGAQIKLQEGELANQNARTQIMRDELTMKQNALPPAPKLHGVKFDNKGNAVGIFSDGTTTGLGFKGKEPDGGASAFANFLAKKEWMDANTPRKTAGELVGSPLSGKDVMAVRKMRDGDTLELYGRKFMKSKGGYLPLN